MGPHALFTVRAWCLALDLCTSWPFGLRYYHFYCLSNPPPPPPPVPLTNLLLKCWLINLNYNCYLYLNCICASFPQETPTMEDQCSFQEPMARLIKGNNHIDFYHFYNRVDVVDDPCEDRLKHYHKKDFYPFRPCSFMGLQASCPNNSWEVLRIYFDNDNLEPIYKCKNGTWVDKGGLTVKLWITTATTITTTTKLN